MKVFLRTLLLLLIAVPLVAYAQDTQTQTVPLDTGFSITVPADWTMTKNEDGSFTLAGSNLAVAVTTPVALSAQSVNFTSKTNIVDALISLVTLYDGVQPDRSAVHKTPFGARAGAVYLNTESNTNDQLDIVLAMSDHSFGYLAFSAAKGQIDILRPQIDTIAATFDVSGDATEEAAQTQTNGTGATGATGVACTVSTDKANTAQLRVGPGTNRGAIAFLPANVDVSVTGRIALDDGSVWYQLDKSQAAPKGTAAAQLWVEATAVTASGDCDQVSDTSAPPVIPGQVIQPTPQPSGSGSSGQQPAPSSPGALPASGRWTLTIDPTSNGSCAGGGNVQIPSTELFDDLGATDTVSIINNGAFNYSENRFNRIAGTNSFEGFYTFDDGFNVQLRFNLVSATVMTGWFTGNFTVNGTACSATSTFTDRHG